MKVTLVRAKSGNALVEWRGEDGDYHRSTVPEHFLSDSADGTAECPNPEEGVPYGAPWAEIVGALRTMPADVERELRRAGVWTVGDLLSRPNAAAAALQSAYGLDAQGLIRRARKWAVESDSTASQQ